MCHLQTQQIQVRNLNTIDINGTSNTFFIAPAENGKYEVQFGDNVLGKALDNGNIVQCTYRKSNADVPNSANVFTLVGDIQGYDNVAITTITSARGGSFPETDESIRKNASRSLSIQDRTVTDSDKTYQTKLSDIGQSMYGGKNQIHLNLVNFLLTQRTQR